MNHLLHKIGVSALLVATTGLVPLHAAHHESNFHSDVVTNMDGANKKILALAEAVPADQYAWKPNIEVRSISEVLMHVAGVNLLLPAALGAAPPEGLEIPENPFSLLGEWEKNIIAKDDVIAKLKESFDYVGKAIHSITDLEAQVAIFGPPSSKRSYILILQSHAHEHLGQSIAYARSLGIAPPWSQPLPPSETAEAEAD